jgi:Na+/proline symporter
MFASLSWIDYSLLGLYLAAMVGLGIFFSGRQRDSTEFFLASRSFGWFPLGLSLMATLISALTYTGLPGQAYEQGLRTWVIPAAYWLILPLLVYLVIPIFRGLALSSLYEYLEYRFDSRVRLAATVVFVVWRMLWLGGVIYAPCKVLLIAAGWQVPAWVLIIPLGAITTLYTYLGGMRTVIWTDVIQGCAMLAGVALVVVGVWLVLDGGPARVSEVASGLGRLETANLRFKADDPWSLWGILPHWILAALSFYVADQITAQRFLCAKSVFAARTSYLVNTLALTCMLGGLVYLGLCLVAFYHDHPEALRPDWVVNVDGQTREVIREQGGQRLLDPARPEDRLTWETVDQLVAEGRVLQPNSKEPFTDAAELVDPDSRRLMVEKLAMRRPDQSPLAGEVILRRGVAEELFPHFLATQLPWGVAGLVLAALLAGAMSSIDSGLNAIGTIIVVDLHRRFGWGRAWLARRLGKSAEELTDVDELVLARPLTLVIGVAATLFALAVSQIGEIFRIMIGVANTFGGPLLAIFLLGMLSRRATAAGALVGLVVGSLATMGLALSGPLARAGVPIPAALLIADIWHVVFGVGVTWCVAWGVSWLLGTPKSNLDLRGLVAGCGTLGVRAADETMPIISIPEKDDADASRWK